MAFPEVDFHKPARVAKEGLLEHSMAVPEYSQRAQTHTKVVDWVRPIDPSVVLIGVTDMVYTAPGLYYCKLCDEPFDENNKTFHVASCTHRINVFMRWNTDLYDEAMNAKEMGVEIFSAKCDSIASDIFPVEQQVLNYDQQQLYKRLMGTSSALDDTYYSELRREQEALQYGARYPHDPSNYSRHDHYRSESRYHDSDYNHRSRGSERELERNEMRHPGTESFNLEQVSIDSDITCDLGMECVRMLLRNLNKFASETKNSSLSRIEVLKVQILFDEVLKAAHPQSQRTNSSVNYVTVLDNGRLTLRREGESSKSPPAKKYKSGISDEAKDFVPLVEDSSNRSAQPPKPRSPTPSVGYSSQGEPSCGGRWLNYQPNNAQKTPLPPTSDHHKMSLLPTPDHHKMSLLPTPDKYRTRGNERPREVPYDGACDNHRSLRKRSPSPSKVKIKSKEQKRPPLGNGSTTSNGKQPDLLSDHVISQREKQVRFGKVTQGYLNYTAIVPHHLRNIRDPGTPNPEHPYSKRCWDGLVRAWRRKLHTWDDPAVALAERGKYTRNNQDLKFFGKLNKVGEVVVPLGKVAVPSTESATELKDS